MKKLNWTILKVAVFLAALLAMLAFLIVLTPGSPLVAQAAPAIQNRAKPAVEQPRLAPESPDALINAQGKLTYLRVNDVGTGYGPATDFIDAEVIIKLDSVPGQSMGFTLRNDTNSAAHTGMLGLLREAYKNNWTVSIDYDLPAGKTNGIIIRVVLFK